MRINQKAVLEEEKGEGILFEPDSLLTLWLNESSILIWKDLKKGLVPGEIVLHLSRFYEGAKEEELAKDVASVIRSFEESGFLIVDP